jgi:hypothetical protein
VGLILDSSVLIAAERKGQNARQALAEIAVRAAGEDVAMSVVTTRNWKKACAAFSCQWLTRGGCERIRAAFPGDAAEAAVDCQPPAAVCARHLVGHGIFCVGPE